MELTDKHNIALLRVFSPRPLQSVGDDKAFFVAANGTEKANLAIETYENALIVGDRGSGKTSLLNHLRYEYSSLEKNNSNIPVQLNLSRVKNFNQTAFLKTLIYSIVDSTMKCHAKNKNTLKEIIRVTNVDTRFLQKIPEGSISNDNKKNDVSFEILAEQLQELVSKLQNQNVRIFIIADDGDKTNPGLIWDMFRGIRDILWNLKTPIILSILPEQVSVLTKPPLDQFFTYQVKMKPFDQDKTEELILKRIKFARQKISLEKDVLARLLNDTGGNPRNIISIMKRVFESTTKTNKITEKMIDGLNLPYSSELNGIESHIVSYLVHNPYTSASSEDFSDSVGVTRSRIAQILNGLKEKNLIESKKEGKKVKYFVKQQIGKKQ